MADCSEKKVWRLHERNLGPLSQSQLCLLLDYRLELAIIETLSITYAFGWKERLATEKYAQTV